MTQPLTVKRNDYHKNKKNSTVYTPPGVARFLFDLLKDEEWYPLILDPAIGTGILTMPWFDTGHTIWGCDIEQQTECVHEFVLSKFENAQWKGAPDLVLCNPPFNGAPGKRLYPEVFLEHIFNLFGVNQPVALFVPMGFRLNQRIKSKRWRRVRDRGAEITSIISLPLDIFKGVEFHSEILIFNIPGLKSHYFLPEEYL